MKRVREIDLEKGKPYLIYGLNFRKGINTKDVSFGILVNQILLYKFRGEKIYASAFRFPNGKEFTSIPHSEYFEITEDEWLKHVVMERI